MRGLSSTLLIIGIFETLPASSRIDIKAVGREIRSLNSNLLTENLGQFGKDNRGTAKER